MNVEAARERFLNVDMEVSVRPWVVPNYATLIGQQGEGVEVTYSVESLSSQALDSLANRWLNDLYAKAKKKSPWGRE